MLTVEISDRGGTYTARLARVKASCTAGPECAAKRLADKLFGGNGRVLAVRYVRASVCQADIDVAQASSPAGESE